MSKKDKYKVIAIVGTTASGKTNLAVAMSMEFRGEVVSADSRQVYKHMDIGSGKDLNEYEVVIGAKKIKIPYHLIDVAHPRDLYDLAKWLRDAKIAISRIIENKKLPIIAGGTGLYAQALLDGYNLSEASADRQLRESLEKKDVKELYLMLEKLNKKFAQSLNESEVNNKRRLIRHIEILSNLEDPSLIKKNKNKERPYNDFIIGLSWPREILRERIQKRIMDRINNEGMIDEVRKLHNEHGVSWQRLESFGLEYKYLAYFLQDKMSYEETLSKLYFASCQFAKRQMTWLRRWEKQGAKINWVEGHDEALKLAHKFLKS